MSLQVSLAISIRVMIVVEIKDMDLLPLDNQAMEDDVERLLKQQTDNNIGAIWIAGRGTSDYKWRYMNDFEFKGIVYTGCLYRFYIE